MIYNKLLIAFARAYVIKFNLINYTINFVKSEFKSDQDDAARLLIGTW